MDSDWDLVAETGLGCEERATVLDLAELLLTPIPAYSLGRSRNTSAATRVLTFWLAASTSA